MALRVLIVDDSRFFRRRVTEILNADPRLEVIGHAGDGAEAIKQVVEQRPDVITMDIEMPVMDGITATRRIMATHPTPIVMFSSLTTEGAKATLDALDAGAIDFLPKRFEDIAKDRDEAKRQLCERVVAIGRRGVTKIARSAQPVENRRLGNRPDSEVPGLNAATKPGGGNCFKLIAIGASTGGPVALQTVLTKLPADFPLPMVLVQHMPASFTQAFAQRLDRVCAIRVKQADDGDVIVPGTAYLAPGGRQMVLKGRGEKVFIQIEESKPEQNYRPSVDVTFSSASRIYPRAVLAVVLTGMGADGRDGANLLKRGGSEIWAQDEASSVVYGMPAAIVEAGIADHVCALADIGGALLRKIRTAVTINSHL